MQPMPTILDVDSADAILITLCSSIVNVQLRNSHHGASAAFRNDARMSSVFFALTNVGPVSFTGHMRMSVGGCIVVTAYCSICFVGIAAARPIINGTQFPKINDLGSALFHGNAVARTTLEFIEYIYRNPFIVLETFELVAIFVVDGHGARLRRRRHYVAKH